jgi:hypothetical protein
MIFIVIVFCPSVGIIPIFNKIKVDCLSPFMIGCKKKGFRNYLKRLLAGWVPNPNFMFRSEFIENPSH